MESAKILGLSIGAACVYGVCHDQVTARICVEYFTIGHPPVFGTDDPTLLGLGWGVIATWWVGAILGVALASAARVGPREPVPARALVRPIATLLLVMGAASIVFGLIGHVLARAGTFVLVGWLAQRVPADRHVAFLTAGWAHGAAYGVGFIGGIVLAVRTWRRRPPSAPVS